MTRAKAETEALTCFKSTTAGQAASAARRLPGAPAQARPLKAAAASDQ